MVLLHVGTKARCRVVFKSCTVRRKCSAASAQVMRCGQIVGVKQCVCMLCIRAAKRIQKTCLSRFGLFVSPSHQIKQAQRVGWHLGMPQSNSLAVTHTHKIKKYPKPAQTPPLFPGKKKDHRQLSPSRPVQPRRIIPSDEFCPCGSLPYSTFWRSGNNPPHPLNLIQHTTTPPLLKTDLSLDLQRFSQ